MPFRARNTYRSLGWLVAVSLCFGTALAQGGKSDVGRPVQNQAETKQATPPPPTPPVVSAKKSEPKPDPDNYQTPCDNPKSETDSDLCQQWRMAEAAEEMADWTLGQLISTSVEVVLIFIAIGVALYAGYWARRAAKAGDKTVKVASIAVQDTRESNERQLRAYVCNRAVGWKRARDEATKQFTGFAVKIDWENCGTTPASRCLGYTNSSLFPEDTLPSDFAYPDATSGRSQVTEMGYIGPGQQIHSTLYFDPADIKLVAQKKRYLFVWGWLEYDDIFEGSPRHRSETCVRVDISPDRQRGEPVIAGPYNGIDGSCHHEPKT